MTKKLKKKVNRIIYSMLAVMVGIVTFLCLNAEVFVMPMSLENIDKTGVGETVTYSGVSPLSDGGVVECESIVQGARDHNLSDRKLHIQSNGKR